MRIWRLTIKPAAEIGINPSRFCLERNILGFGWPVEQDAPMDWDTYYQLGQETYPGDPGWNRAAHAICRIEVNDLCWTRDRDGTYYIGKIKGSWEYRSTDDYRDADIVNVRPCRWFRVGGVDSVPGKVLNSFRVGSTLQQVHDETVTLYSKWKYNQLSKEIVYDLPQVALLDLFSLIAPDDCEDIVGIYLQEKRGYRLIPSTCKRDTPKTEFVLRKAEGKAYVQVKQGNVDLNRDEFNDSDLSDPCEWFLFTTHGRYAGRENSRVHCLDPDNMRDFALNNRRLMSSRVQAFIAFLDFLA